MSGSVNKVILIGNMGAAAEIRTMQSGGRVANLSVATSEHWKDKTTGEKKEATQWHRVIVFNDGLVNVLEKYSDKGSKLYVEGMLETSSWEKDGVKHYTTEVVIRPFHGTLTILDGFKDTGENSEEYKNQGKDNYEPEASVTGRSASYAAPSPFGESIDDEIPF